MLMTIQIGDVFPWEAPKGILGESLETPEWYILTVISQKERAAKAKLDLWGVSETWFPVEQAWRKARPKHGQANRAREPYDRLIAPGYVFALFDREPIWHRLWPLARGIVTGVVGDEMPRVIPEKVIGAMKHVPKRIEILREQESAKEKAARLAKMPQTGGIARLTEGPFAGHLVNVTRIDRGIAWFVMQGIQGSAEIEKLERDGQGRA